MMGKFILMLKKLKNLNLLLLLLPSVLLANIPVKHTPIPGGIAVIDFQTNHANPKAFYNKRALYLQLIKDQHWQALIGIPLLEKSGKKSFIVKDFSTRTFNFEVKTKPGAYAEQHITLTGKKKKYVNPNLAYMTRINKERPLLSNARKVFSAHKLSTGAFSRPVSGVVTSAFGLKRFYNGKPRRAHTGVDYAGDVGTPIFSPSAGKVLLTGHFFFNGNTVFIDHGQGLISVYIHMSNIAVNQGDAVKKSQQIGNIGQTGRATGPHLHWGVYLNQTVINPNLLLLDEI